MDVTKFVKARETFLEQVRELINSGVQIIAGWENKDVREDVEYKNRTTVIVAETMLLEALIIMGDCVNRLEAFDVDTKQERQAVENIATAMRIMSDTLTMNTNSGD